MAKWSGGYRYLELFELLLLVSRLPVCVLYQIFSNWECLTGWSAIAPTLVWSFTFNVMLYCKCDLFFFTILLQKFCLMDRGLILLMTWTAARSTHLWSDSLKAVSLKCFDEVRSTCWSEPQIFEDTFKYEYTRVLIQVTRWQFKQLYLAIFSCFVYYLLLAQKAKKQEAFEHVSVWSK